MALKICLLAGTLLLLQTGLTAQTQVAAQPAAGIAAPAVAAAAQAATESTQSSATLTSVPRVPGMGNKFRGFNAGLNYAGVHNSAIGWYTVLTPALSYAFSEHYSADVSSSIYLKRRYLTYINGNPARPRWINEVADGGDTLFGFHATFNPRVVEEIATFTLSAPTGDTVAGLGTGHVTYDFNNHLEHYHRQFGMFLDAGAGNSSVLFNNLVTRNYSTLGGLAHFMVGAENWFGERFFAESLLYEQLPFGSQQIYAQPTARTTPAQPSPTPAVSTSANEDNGITTYLGIPMTGNLTFSGYYSRSLRRHADTVSFGVTWVLRGRRFDSLVDKALKEAEKSAPEQ